MRCWLCVTSPENWEKSKNTGSGGLEDRYEITVKKLTLGDVFVFYVKQPVGAITGVYIVSSKWYYNEKPVGWSKIFPYRVRITPLLVPPTPIKLDDKRVEELLFFTDKSRDARRSFFLASMFPIPDDDCRTIIAWLEEEISKQKVLTGS
ncbi:MAG: EVE domain-containing protein [Candidatus Bathyarchaeota archaeon]|jgi:predicted RNA-binding protein|nr:EVE domain-containing protein [Candidatus Bathyarchaeota archaeon A05DMB-5]MDH7558330.1 EVE domain-containing protein [Candidatus Bathyarchaeota archaeon]